MRNTDSKGSSYPLGMNSLLASILQEFGIASDGAQAKDLAGAGGFSGAQLWRIRRGELDLCLRQWPAEQDTERLRFIHAVICHAARKVKFLPVPHLTPRGESFVEQQGKLWELSPWLPGEANHAGPMSSPRLGAALMALAQFHQATADFSANILTPQPSPGLQARLTQIEQLLAGGANKLQAAIPACSWAEFRLRAQWLLQLFMSQAPEIRRQLQVGAQLPVKLQPCLRDVWSEHVLLSGETVTGLVDFGALRMETVAGDVARLLGSYVADDRSAWQPGLKAYSNVRTLDPVEAGLVEVFDSSQVLLSGMNWLDWVLLQQREFADHDAILRRLDATIARLEHRRRNQRLIIAGEP